MGGGSWSSKAYSSYTSTTRGVTLDNFTTMNYSAQDMYVARSLDPLLNPKGVTRLCHDSEEHPNTFPIILALDVTGSMGDTAVRVSQKLNEIMTRLYEDPNIKDVEFCVMGIGDLAYDRAPIQISQFESDIRIAEQLDKIYFEAGGGGNTYESYTAAWYMGSRHCELDCWKRGQKGLIITLGDELPNPYLPQRGLSLATGDKLQGDIETSTLYEETKEKFNIYHIAVKDNGNSFNWHDEIGLSKKWNDLLGDNFYIETLDSLTPRIIEIIKNNANESIASNDVISW